MGLVVPDVGEVILLDVLVNGDTLAAFECRLYQNNYTPVQGSTLSNFTVATFSGYAADWTTFGPATIVSNKGKIVATTPVSFVHNGGATSNTIYGYYIVDTVTNEVVWAEKFAASQAMSNNGDTINIPLQLTMNSEN